MMESANGKNTLTKSNQAESSGKPKGNLWSAGRREIFDPAARRWRISEAVREELERGVGFDETGTEAGIVWKRLMASLSRYSGFPEDHIALVSDTAGIFDSLLSCVPKSDNEFLICGPADADVSGITGQSGIKVRFHYAPSPFISDSEGIAARMTEKTGLVYLPNPNAWTGVGYNAEEVEKILERNHRALLFLDESYFEFHGTSPAGLIYQYDNLIIQRSFSRALGLTGLPFHYILASPSRIAGISSGQRFQNFTLRDLAAADAVLGDLDHVQNYINRKKENLIYLSVRLRGMNIKTRISSAGLLLVKVARPERVVSFLNRSGDFAKDPSGFQGMQNYVAIEVQTDDETARLIDLFRKMPKDLYSIEETRRPRIILRHKHESR